MPEIWWPTTPAETPHVPKNQSNTFSKIQAGPPPASIQIGGPRVRKWSEQRRLCPTSFEGERAPTRVKSAPEILSPETLSAAAYPFIK